MVDGNAQSSPFIKEVPIIFECPCDAGAALLTNAELDYVLCLFQLREGGKIAVHGGGESR